MTEETIKPSLSAADVESLLADPSAASRADAAAKVGTEFSRGILNENERALAEDIFRLLVKDVEVRVREALSMAVRECVDLPRDVAVSLAQDVDEVALPILASSTVLTDEDLIGIIKVANSAKQQAIATRETVSGAVSEALIERGDEDALHLLLSNHGAEIPEAAYEDLIEKFGDRERMHEPLAHRPALPLGIAERLVAMVSDNLQDHILKAHPLRPAMVSDLIVASRERATVSLLDGREADDAVQQLVRQLHVNGRLTGSIILRAVCLGDMRFCEVALSELARVPLDNARSLINDAGQLGLKGIYDKAGLPQELFPAIRVAIDVVRDMEYDGGEHDRERFRRRAIQRILTRYQEVDADDLEYLLTKLTEFGQVIEGEAA